MSTIIVLKFLLLCSAVVVSQSEDLSCGTVSHQEWSGDKLNRHLQLTHPVSLVVLHHTATPQCNARVDCVKRVNSIRDYQMKNLTFDDIGLSCVGIENEPRCGKSKPHLAVRWMLTALRQRFLAGGDGSIYEGAGWHYVGAHTLGYNWNSVGIYFVGDFRETLPNKNALEAVHDLLACGVRHGHLTADYRLAAGCQLRPVESPGKMLFDDIKKWPNWKPSDDLESDFC